MSLHINVIVYLLFQWLVSENTGFNFNENERYLDELNGYQNSEARLGFPWRRPSFTYVEKIPGTDLDQTLYNNDRLDFHYPKVEFLTKIDRKYTLDNTDDDFQFMKHQKFVGEAVTKPNYFDHINKLKIQEDIKYQPIKLSYVEKVPKEEENTTIGTRYEENGILTNNNTKNNLHNFLKNYLQKLYSQTYNNTETTAIRPSSFSKLTDTNDGSKADAENKFIGGVVSKIKQKAVHKSKLFSLFTIVQFNNTQCNATSSSVSYLGVCYTAAECNRISGTPVGNCASGYGVCCVGKYNISTHTL